MFSLRPLPCPVFKPYMGDDGYEIKNGRIVSEEDKKQYTEYWKDNLRHRSDGPAISIEPIGFSNCLSDDHYEWWVDGKRHRTDGPAISSRILNNDTAINDVWFINGNKFDIKQFLSDFGFTWVNKDAILLLKLKYE